MNYNQTVQSLHQQWRIGLIRSYYIVVSILCLVELGMYPVLDFAGLNPTKPFSLYLLEFVVLPTALNFAMVALAHWAVKSRLTDHYKNVAIILSLCGVCSVIATVHAYFLVAASVFLAPVVVAMTLNNQLIVNEAAGLSAAMVLLTAWTGNLFTDGASLQLRMLTACIVCVIILCIRLICSASIRLMAQVTGIVLQSTEHEQHAKYASEHDVLTGMKNRRAYERRISEIETTLPENEDAMLVMLDLNGLKRANDTYGHHAGDELLLAAARAISVTYAEDGDVYRIGGDEFVAVIAPFRGSSERYNRRLREAIEAHNQRSDNKLSIAYGEGHLLNSVGRRVSVSDWKQEADINMYICKEAQKNPVVAETDRAFSQIVSGIVAVVEAKDPSSIHHAHRVSRLAGIIAKHLNLSDYTVSRISMAAKLHDIGKISVSDEILRKPGKLNAEELQQVHRHTTIGAQILMQVEDMHDVASFVLHHHENFDGTGYPDQLRGEEIPMGSRIIALADSIDTMMTGRPYHGPCTLEECRREIERNLGIMYDPSVGRITLDHWDEVETLVLAGFTER